AQQFLKPSLAHLHDPFLLRNMDKGVSRLKKAKEHHEKVLVYGDYDVDGVTGTAVLSRFLKKFGVSVKTYIPHRMEEGYGLNYDIIPLAKAEGVTLLITVDCGITSSGEIEELKRQGIDTIVIDHHEPENGQFPDAAIAVIDPKCPGCEYPFRDLAGVGLAAKFVQAVLGEFPEEELDLITLGTIADVVPLLGEKRTIARFGLPFIGSSSKEGLKALLDLARIKDKEMTPYSVGFVLGPRLNAAGRMGSANTSLDLLLCDDLGAAYALAQSLDGYNKERQKLQTLIVEEAMDIIKKDAKILASPVIVVHKEGWHKGVLGIAASKISDKYARPAIVISMVDGLGVGSARSVEGFALHEALAHCSELLEEHGGHKRAAGLRVKNERIIEFSERINIFAEKILKDRDFTPILDIEYELPFAQANWELIHILEDLGPHGEGNPQPLFATRRLMVKSRPQIMGRDTIKFWVTDGRVTLSAVGFGMAGEYEHLKMGQAVDIVYTLGIDDWNKAPQVQLMLKDIRVLTK
ncbi:MAG: single-stranded-DNA-specific exonuclease RecJ, partial [Candidatus Omnitrophica bacterium]|nr:single-stranded-DNA-specific exonuclease RecJ [Candidatus Omnitrophota bacterium]